MPPAAGSIQTRPGGWRAGKTQLGTPNGSRKFETNTQSAPENYMTWKKQESCQKVLPKTKGGLLLSGLNEGACGRLEVRESADENQDGSSVNGIQGQEPRRWWEAIKGSYDWRKTSSGGRERRG